MNDARVHDNCIFDNWRDGARAVRGAGRARQRRRRRGRHRPGHRLPGAPGNGISTSCGNQCTTTRWARRRPASSSRRGVDSSATCARPAPAARCPTASTSGGTSSPATPATAGTTTRGPTARGSITGPGAGSPPDPLPSNCERAPASGTRQARDRARLRRRPRRGDRPARLPLVADPAEAGRQRGRAERGREVRSAAKRFEGTDEADKLRERVRELSAQVAVRLRAAAALCCALLAGCANDGGLSARAHARPGCAPRSRAPRRPGQLRRVEAGHPQGAPASRSRTCAGSSPSRSSKSEKSVLSDERAYEIFEQRLQAELRRRAAPLQALRAGGGVRAAAAAVARGFRVDPAAANRHTLLKKPSAA